MRGSIAAVVPLLIALAAGCEETPELAAREICDAVCDCTAPLPTQHEECATECLGQISAISFPDECLDCAYEAACHELEACFDICFAPEE